MRLLPDRRASPVVGTAILLATSAPPPATASSLARSGAEPPPVAATAAPARASIHAARQTGHRASLGTPPRPPSAPAGPGDTTPAGLPDVRPPSCFTPGPVRGIGRRGHVYGVFPLGDRVVAAASDGRDTTLLLELRADGIEEAHGGDDGEGGGREVTVRRRLDGEIPGLLRAARIDGDSLVLWTERRRFVFGPDGWSAGPNPRPDLFRHHGSPQPGTAVGLGFVDLWVPMSLAWQWTTDVAPGRRLLLWNGQLAANSHDGPDGPGILELRPPGRERGEGVPPFHPLPTPDIALYERLRLEEPLDSLQRASLWLTSDVGAWQRAGGEIWFGVSFYRGEGADGVGGYGRFDLETRRYEMEWGVPDPDRSVSALHHDGDRIWLAQMGRREAGQPAYGVARIDLADGSVQRYDVPGVVTVLCPARGELSAGSRQGLYRLDGDRFVAVWRPAPGEPGPED